MAWIFFNPLLCKLNFKLSPKCSHFLAPWWGIPLAPMCDICTSPKNMTDTRGGGGEEMGPLSSELTTKLSVMIAKSIANPAKYICNQGNQGIFSFCSRSHGKFCTMLYTNIVRGDQQSNRRRLAKYLNIQ